jgi:hypothetical protein
MNKLLHRYLIIIIIIIIITMAQQPYMGLGLLFPRLRGLRIYGSSETSRLAALNPDVTARAIWQSGDLGEKWLLNCAYETFLFMPVRFFYMP